MSSTSASKKRKASSDTPATPSPSHVYAVTSLERNYDDETRKLEALYTNVATANEAARRIHNHGHACLGRVTAEWMNKTAPEDKRVEAEGVEFGILPAPEHEVKIEDQVYRPRRRRDGGMRFGGSLGEGDVWVVWVERVGVDLPLPHETEVELGVQGKPTYAYEDEEEEEEEDQYEDMDRPWH